MSTVTKLTKRIPGQARIIGLLAALILAALACTSADVELLQGILQDVDSANGEITIVTKDGKTITLIISTDAPVDTEGASSSFEALEPGVSIEVKVADDGEHATEISARQSKIHGTVVSVEVNDDGNYEVSIQPEDGGSVVLVIVDESTRIELGDDWSGPLADIPLGADIEVKFDSETGMAFKLDWEREEAEIEGWVENIEGDQVTIRTERGRLLTVTVGENARIELDDDWPGTSTDIVKGLKIEVEFDPSSLAVFEIEIEREKSEIEGWVEAIDGDQLTIKTEHSGMLTLTVEADARIELADDSLGTLADIVDGLKIEADFDPSSLAAFKIEIEREKSEIEGWVEAIDGDQLTIKTEHSGMLTLTVEADARIELADDSVGTLADIVDGLKIEADFDPSSLIAFKIEIEQDEDDDGDDGRS